MVWLGIKREIPEIPGVVTFPLGQTWQVDPETTATHLYVRKMDFDPAIAPPGKTVLSTMIPTRNFAYWQGLRESDREKYGYEKQRILHYFIDTLEQKYGNIREHIEETDVSTPATIYRYTGNWQGSYEGWLLVPGMGFGSLKKTLPGLRNFYMAGQWVEPGGGLPTALMSGRMVSQLICHREGKSFKTEKAASRIRPPEAIKENELPGI